jgi:hypothetical protein
MTRHNEICRTHIWPSRRTTDTDVSTRFKIRQFQISKEIVFIYLLICGLSKEAVRLVRQVGRMWDGSCHYPTRATMVAYTWCKRRDKKISSTLACLGRDSKRAPPGCQKHYRLGQLEGAETTMSVFLTFQYIWWLSDAGLFNKSHWHKSLSSYDRKNRLLRNVATVFTRLDGIISQKIVMLDTYMCLQSLEVYGIGWILN